jgi:hypothetical protein
VLSKKLASLTLVLWSANSGTWFVSPLALESAERVPASAAWLITTSQWPAPR